MTKEEYIKQKSFIGTTVCEALRALKLLANDYRQQLRDEYKDLIGKKVRCYDDYDHGQYLGEAYLSDVDICEINESDGAILDVAPIFKTNEIKKDGTMSQRRFMHCVTRIEPVEEK